MVRTSWCLLVLLCCHQCAALAAHVAGGAASLAPGDGAGAGAADNSTAAVPDSGCSSAVDEAAIRRVEALFRKRIEHRTPEEIYTHHAVIVSPTEPLTMGDGFAAETYLSLPRASVDGSYITAFTKFVLVGHSRGKGDGGVSIGDDVCGAAGLTDAMAVQFLRTKVFQRMGGFAPKVVHCSAPSKPCAERVAPGLERQLPFLAALLGSAHSLKGSLLPMMMQGQDVIEAVRLGDALSFLVQPGGIWEAERVLFVFVGDLSAGLPAAQEGACDHRSAEVLSQRGVPQVAEYFHALLAGEARGGCKGPAAVPRGYGPLLSAATVASKAGLQERRTVVMHEGPIGDSVPYAKLGEPVLGFMSAVFWSETRSAWERLSAEAPPKHSLLARSRGVAPAAATAPA